MGQLAHLMKKMGLMSGMKIWPNPSTTRCLYRAESLLERGAASKAVDVIVIAMVGTLRCCAASGQVSPHRFWRARYLCPSPAWVLARPQSAPPMTGTTPASTPDMHQVDPEHSPEHRTKTSSFSDHLHPPGTMPINHTTLVRHSHVVRCFLGRRR